MRSEPNSFSEASENEVLLHWCRGPDRTFGTGYPLWERRIREILSHCHIIRSDITEATAGVQTPEFNCWLCRVWLDDKERKHGQRQSPVDASNSWQQQEKQWRSCRMLISGLPAVTVFLHTPLYSCAVPPRTLAALAAKTCCFKMKTLQILTTKVDRNTSRFANLPLSHQTLWDYTNIAISMLQENKHFRWQKSQCIHHKYKVFSGLNTDQLSLHSGKYAKVQGITGALNLAQ